MVHIVSGGVEFIPPHRARLFPLPFLATTCTPPSRSARVARHHRVHRWIVAVTNRCIATLNCMYTGSRVSAVQSPPLFLSSPLSCSCQPDKSSFVFSPSLVSDSYSNRPPRGLPQSRGDSHRLLRSDYPSAGPLSAAAHIPHPSVMVSKAQFRLLSHIRDQCALFVSDVRLCAAGPFDGLDASPQLGS